MAPTDISDMQHFMIGIVVYLDMEFMKVHIVGWLMVILKFNMIVVVMVL